MTAALEGGEWSATRPGHTLHPGKTRYPFCRRLGGPQGRSGRTEKSRPHRDSIPDRPARSQSLYRLSYPAHSYISVLSENVSTKFKYHQNLSIMMGTLHDDQHTFFILPVSRLLRMRNVAGKNCRGTQNKRFVFSNFVLKNVLFFDHISRISSLNEKCYRLKL